MRQTETSLIHTGKEFNITPSVTPPIYQTSTYMAPDNADEYIKMAGTTNSPWFYHRYGNPVNSQVAAIIASLEGTETAMLTASGMGAISTAVLAVVKQGDHVIVQRSHYAAANQLFHQLLPDFGIEITVVEQEDNASFEQNIRPNTRLIYIETPSNPILALTDLQFLGELGKKHKIVTMCDNTFATPLNQRPHDFGIDIILHSATKYLGGHSDLCAGVVCASEEWITKIWKRMLILGASLSSFDSWLLLKGLRTLSLRMRQINENAQQIAEWLSNDPRVNKVLYCGLPSHPQFELAKKQMKGFSGMLCMEVAGESDEIQLSNAQKVLNSVKIFANATSLGGVESLIVHPASMWGIKDFPEKQKQIGINNGMLRISVGIENIHDLIADLDQALPAS